MSVIARLFTIVVVLAILFGLLAIFLRGANTQPNPCDEILVVTRNETLESIAARCGVDTNTIYNLNPGLLEEGVTVQAGMVLRLADDANLEDAADAILPPTATP